MNTIFIIFIIYEVFAKNFVALCKAIDFALFLHKYPKQGKKRLFQKCLPFLNSTLPLKKNKHIKTGWFIDPKYLGKGTEKKVN